MGRNDLTSTLTMRKVTPSDHPEVSGRSTRETDGHLSRFVMLAISKFAPALANFAKFGHDVAVPQRAVHQETEADVRKDDREEDAEHRKALDDFIVAAILGIGGRRVAAILVRGGGPPNVLVL